MARRRRGMRSESYTSSSVELCVAEQVTEAEARAKHAERRDRCRQLVGAIELVADRRRAPRSSRGWGASVRIPAQQLLAVPGEAGGHPHTLPRNHDVVVALRVETDKGHLAGDSQTTEEPVDCLPFPAAEDVVDLRAEAELPMANVCAFPPGTSCASRTSTRRPLAARSAADGEPGHVLRRSRGRRSCWVRCRRGAHSPWSWCTPAYREPWPTPGATPASSRRRTRCGHAARATDARLGQSCVKTQVMQREHMLHAVRRSPLDQPPSSDARRPGYASSRSTSRTLAPTTPWRPGAPAVAPVR